MHWKANGEGAARLGELSDAEKAELATTRDAVGIASVYVDFSEGGQHRAETGVRRAFAQLANEEPQGLEAREWRALLDDALDRVVERVEVATEAGERARAVYVPLAEGAAGLMVRVATSVPDLVVVTERPYVRPLLAAEDESRRVAVIGVTDRGLTITEFWGAQPRAEWSLPFSESVQDRRLEGPARSRMMPGRRAEAQADLVNRRLEAYTESAISESLPNLAEQARRHAWDGIVVGGDARDARQLVAGLENARIAAMVYPQHVSSVEERRGALAALGRERAHAHEARAEELVAASAGGRAVMGASATLEALQQSQARSVVLGAPVHGSTTAIPQSPALGIGEGSFHDPLNDVVCVALEHGVPIVTVAGDAGRGLPASAVGALLRPA